MVAEVVERSFQDLQVEHVSALLQALESQFKFAKEFNSEVTLRFHLWKAGYLAELDHLPGLLAQEEESLKAFLGLLFRQFFKAEHKICKPLFPLVSKVLKDYVLKHSELISINASKGAGHRPLKQSINEDQLSALHEAELGKQLQHLSPIIHSVILENLLKLSDSNLIEKIPNIG
jgi:hypothetical protein